MLRKGEADFLASWPSCFHWGLCIFAVSTGWDSSILWSSSRSSWSKLMPDVWSSHGQIGMPIVADVCGEMENWSWQFTSQYLFWNGLFRHTLVTLRLFPLLTIFKPNWATTLPSPRIMESAWLDADWATRRLLFLAETNSQINFSTHKGSGGGYRLYKG